MHRHRWLRIVLATLALFSTEPAIGRGNDEQAQPQTVDIASHVAEAAQRFGLPEQWIYAVMRTESAGQIRAVSSAGAMGLMQLMPGTWARQRARFGLGDDPFDPRDNIMAGTSYLREMYDHYGASGFLAAYNAGPGRYEDWRDRGRRLPAETRFYVAKIEPMLRSSSTAKVIASASTVQSARMTWLQSHLFAPRTNATEAAPVAGIGERPAASPPASPGPPGGLFAAVSGRPVQ